MESKLIVTITFRGIDDWNRPVYRATNSTKHYGSVNILLPDKRVSPNNNIKEINAYFREHISELEYFGEKFNCEPHGGLNSIIQLEIID